MHVLAKHQFHQSTLLKQKLGNQFSHCTSTKTKIGENVNDKKSELFSEKFPVRHLNKHYVGICLYLREGHENSPQEFNFLRETKESKSLVCTFF